MAMTSCLSLRTSPSHDTETGEERAANQVSQPPVSPRPPRRRSTSTRSERDRKAKRQHKKRGRPGKAKSQHSLDHLSTRVSELLSIFESKGWYIPLPDSDEKKGKQWSNRNYGADKKRQRKANERQMIEARIQQLERVLRDEYDYSM